MEISSGMVDRMRRGRKDGETWPNKWWSRRMEETMLSW
jgi:hypothetical protein